jgi:DNA polymerase III delta prime subunit
MSYSEPHELPEREIQKELPQHRYHRSESILLDMIRHEIRMWVNLSFHRQILNRLPNPDCLERTMPWDREIRLPDRPVYLLSNQDSLKTVLEDSRQLLILGVAGSGKTTWMLDLARELLEEAERDPNKPIPVLFNLRTLDPKTKIEDWLAHELKAKYGIHLSLGHHWISQQVIFPFLDGLNELKPDYQKLCLQRLKAWISPKTQVVICSRTEEYPQYWAELSLRGTVVLQPLRLQQVYTYLDHTQATGLEPILQKNPSFLEWSKTPFYLCLLVLLFKAGIPLQEWSQQATSQQLIEAYVHNLFTSNQNRKLKPHQLDQWLSWLAVYLEEASTFRLMDPIQSHYLSKQMQRRHHFVSIGLGGILGGILGISGGGFGGVLLGTLSGLGVAFKIDTYKLPGLLPWEGLVDGVVFGLISGATWGIISTGIGLWVDGPIFGLVMGVNTGVILGVLSGVVFSLSGSPMLQFLHKVWQHPTRPFSQQTFFSSLLIAGVVGFVGGLLGGVKAGLFIGAFLGLLYGIWSGGASILRQISLHLLLYAQGRIPWNYAIFLGEGLRLKLLHQIRGRVMFAHPLVQRYFRQKMPKAFRSDFNRRPKEFAFLSFS